MKKYIKSKRSEDHKEVEKLEVRIKDLEKLREEDKEFKKDFERYKSDNETRQRTEMVKFVDSMRKETASLVNKCAKFTKDSVDDFNKLRDDYECY